MQTEPRVAEAEEVQTSEDRVNEFLQRIARRMECALIQNEVFDLFAHDYASLKRSSSLIVGSKEDNRFKQYQSFAYMGKENQRVTALSWHPTIHGLEKEEGRGG